MFWSPALPEGFKRFAAQVSIDTSAIQYENDELMRPRFGDDTAIACCVSAMPVGKQMQFFGARVNLAKTLLYAINGGRDEVSGEQVGPDERAGERRGPRLRRRAWRGSTQFMDWLAQTYVNALNVIHYMHDKYAYERLEMALHDYAPRRTLACGIAGLSVAADSPVGDQVRHGAAGARRDRPGRSTTTSTGEFPTYGNNDDRVDAIAVELVETFMEKVRHYPAYRNADHTQSVLTITSNVVYGKHTGNTPDGRRAGEPFAPGANPMHGRDHKGLVAAALSVAKLPYDDAEDGISLTASVAAGRARQDRAGADRRPGRHPRRLHGCRRVPHERQRAQPRDAAGRDGAPGEVPAADHPGVRVRRELRPADPRAAARRHQPHVPHEPLMADYRRREGTGSTDARPPPPRRHRSSRTPTTAEDGQDGQDGQVTGYIHSAETTGTVNGPGVRYTLYMSGCPLRCLYCHNPDTWEMRMGEKVHVDQVVDDIGEYIVFLRTTHGGLTTSGGEPLLQPAFLLALYRQVKARWDLHTALDTSGNLGERATDELLDLTDLVLLDVKSGRAGHLPPRHGRRARPHPGVRPPARRAAATGCGSATSSCPVTRTRRTTSPPPPGTSPSLGEPVERVEVLPYHDLGTHKYAELGLSYPLAGVPGPTPEQVEAARAAFTDEGLVVM